MDAAVNDGLLERLREYALAEGFSGFGVCSPDAIPEAAARLQAYVEGGYHGDMTWMAERQNWRGDPSELWPEARSVIMLTENYGPSENPLPLLDMKDRGYISVYARNRDYHDLVKKRLKRVGRWLLEQAGGNIKVFVDTAPVMENRWGQRRVWGGKGSIPIWLAANRVAGFFWGRFSRHWISARTNLRLIIAVVVGNVWIFARRRLSWGRTNSMRGSVFRI